MFETEDRTIYKVIINREEQYALYKADHENPLGWKDVGKTGTKGECQAYIDEVWVDRRPLSLRKRMEEMEKERRERPVRPIEDFPRGAPGQTPGEAVLEGFEDFGLTDKDKRTKRYKG
jgi:MbtH protein